MHDEINEAIALLKTASEKYEKAKSEIRADRDELQAKHDEVAACHVALVKELKELKAEHEEECRSNDDVSASHAALIKEIAKLKEENDDLVKRYDGLVVERNRLNEALKEALNDDLGWKGAYERVKDEVRKARDDRDAWHEEMVNDVLRALKVKGTP